MVEIILSVKNLNVELDNEDIIDNLSFNLNRGEVLTILGPNGAGKTVLLKSLLGALPYKGEIKWKEGIKIGYVPQRLPFIKDIPLNVLEFFKLKNATDKEIEEMLKLFKFNESFLNKKIGELSSGQFQRVLIAWSLAKHPDVLLFDEPTTGVDVGGEETIYSLLSELKKKRKLTIILVTHDLSVVHSFSDYVICLNKTPLCQGTPKKILTSANLQKLYKEEVKFYQHIH